MTKELEIRVAPEHRADESEHRRKIAKILGIEPRELGPLSLLRRSLDARHGKHEYLLRYRLDPFGESAKPIENPLRLQSVANARPVIIVGCGPAGLFAALQLIERGLRPILLERGKNVRNRRRDIARLTKQGEVDPDSNYCFGEGGAGTFSDGKLYTRSQKRGSVERVLKILVHHGADPEILVDAHPHIGTNRLPAVVEAIRETILSVGGEVHFEHRMLEIVKDSGSIRSVRTTGGSFPAEAMLLATGHSARDVYHTLYESGISLEQKPFAIGVRVEHPQALIDTIQYGGPAAPKCLPSSSYALRAQVDRRGVFSFCMCPGGIICPAATSSHEVVVNGWSPSKRNSRFANSGIVVEVPLASFPQDQLFAGLEYQRQIEERAFVAGGGRQVAPAQRLVDFVDRRISQNVPECSYLPGIRACNLHEVLPPEIGQRLTEAFRSFGNKLRGYLTNDAIVVAPESRTSSPIRIPRDSSSRMHPEVPGLFPCGEGAGFAGGIVSAAMDGERSAQAVADYLGC